jgi:hypothetical protein
MYHDVGQSNSTTCGAAGPGRRECLARSSGAPTGRNRTSRGIWEELSVSLAGSIDCSIVIAPRGSLLRFAHHRDSDAAAIWSSRGHRIIAQRR